MTKNFLQAFFIFDTLAFGAQSGWYFAFDAQTLGWNFALLVFTVVTIYISIGITLKQTEDNADEVGKNNQGKYTN